MRHTKIALLAGSAVAASMLSACGREEHAKHPFPENRAVTGITLLTVRRAVTPTTYEATGTVRATLNATLSSKVMARITDVAVKEGDRVRRGDTLVRLDSRELDSAIRMASAQFNSASAGVGNAQTAARLEAKTSEARIAQAEAAVNQAGAAAAAAQARLDLALAGPRSQERSQAHSAVQLAEANLKLAQTERDRTSWLVKEGAVAARQLDVAENALAVAKAQYDSTVQAERITVEGSRQEEIRAAREGVVQAQAAYRQAQANLRQAKASALQIEMRQQEVRTALAQANQARAALGSAEVVRSYAAIAAPFEGTIVSRLADPGAMAAPGAPLFVIEGGALRLEATVPESVLERVRLGTSVEVILDARGSTGTGKVVEIAPQGDASTHTFLVKIQMPQKWEARSGMFGRARFRIGDSEKLLVPLTAVWEREGLRYVFAVNPEGIARLRIVTVGATLGDQVEVLSGLAPGERIVTLGRERVEDGAKVGS